MKYSTALLFAAGALAAPTALDKRAITDATILNYALTLEHLEDKFYREAVANYSMTAFMNAGYIDFYYKNIQEISRDESTHVAFLTGAIKSAGYTPVQECKYAFPSTDVPSFIALANVLEGVGVTAYLGAAQYIANKAYLTAAGSILTIEARHSSYLRRSMQHGSPFPQPFDVPLDFNEVYSLASQFIVSCPSSNPKLPFKAFPTLAPATGSPSIVPQGSTLMLTSAKALSGTVYAAFITVTGPIVQKATIVNAHTVKIVVPSHNQIAGQSYAVLAKSKTISDSTILAGPAIVEIASTYLM